MRTNIYHGRTRIGHIDIELDNDALSEDTVSLRAERDNLVAQVHELEKQVKDVGMLRRTARDAQAEVERLKADNADLRVCNSNAASAVRLLGEDAMVRLHELALAENYIFDLRQELNRWRVRFAEQHGHYEHPRRVHLVSEIASVYDMP